MGSTGLVAVYIKKNTDSGNMYYVCTDRQGSITALLNANGTVAEKYSYDAYGRRRNPLNWNDYNVPAPSLINRGYTGHEMLDGFGLINMNGRMYDPVIGRVLSPDAFVQAPGYTQSYNRYSYSMNNPLRYSDPSGWLVLSNGHKVGYDFNDWGVANSAELYMPGSSSGFKYNTSSGDYTLNGEVVSYWQVHNDYIKPLSSFSLSGPDAGDLVSRVLDGFSLYSYDLFGRQNLVLSVGDPILVANTDGDGGYFTLNPTAGSYLYGTIAFGQSGDNSSWIKTSIEYAGNIAYVAGIANKGREALEVEFIRQATFNASLASIKTANVASSVKAISRMGKVLGVVGTVATYGVAGYQVATGKDNTSTWVDVGLTTGVVVVGIISAPVAIGAGLIYGGARFFWGDEIDGLIDNNWGYR